MNSRQPQAAKPRPWVPVEHRTRCAAMTLIETALNIAVAAALMGVLVLVAGSLRSDSAQQQTRRTLRALREALTTYPTPQDHWQGFTTAQILDMLTQNESAWTKVEPLPRITQADGAMAVIDGFGRPIRFQPGSPDDARHADFISAGPDGNFGDDNPRAAMDNIYGLEIQSNPEQPQ